MNGANGGREAARNGAKRMEMKAPEGMGRKEIVPG